MFVFLLSTVAISISGVMAPGPITAATLAAGARSRHAGAMIALGHAIVEIPLIFLLVVGVGGLLESRAVRAEIGFAGGVVLVLLAVQLLLNLHNSNSNAAARVQRHPVVIGIVLTAANPYFLVWWATVGLTLATKAVEFGVVMLALFAIVHWLCDLAWLEVLSVAGFKGTEIFGRRAQMTVSIFCAIMLLGFGAKFVYDAGIEMIALNAVRIYGYQYRATGDGSDGGQAGETCLKGAVKPLPAYEVRQVACTTLPRRPHDVARSLLPSRTLTCATRQCPCRAARSRP